MRIEEEERPHGEMRGRLVFSSGRRLDIWGVIGLNPVALTLHYGYDGDVSEEADLTTAERVELANYMTEKWADYRVEAMRGDRGEEEGGEKEAGEVSSEG